MTITLLTASVGKIKCWCKP